MKSGDSNLYIPQRADTVWMDFSPQSGREQAGRRPALVISRLRYNRRAGLALVCPITSKVKGYRFEVPIPEGLPVSGVVLADHVKSLDWRSRRTEFACQMPAEVLVQVVEAIRELLTGVLE